MKDDQKTKRKLIEELNEQRQRVAELEGLEEELGQMRANYEKFMRAFLQSSVPVGITTLKEGRFIDVSDAFLRLIGRNRGEVIGHKSVEIGFITEEQRSSFIYELNQKGRVENLEMKVGTKGGASIHALFNAVMMSIKNEKYLLTVMTDITERKQAEEALRGSQQQLHQITDNIPAFVTYVNAKNLRYKFVNKPYADALGKSPEEMIGRQVKDILSEEAYLRALPYIDRARSGERIRYENMVPIHGEPRWFSIDYIPELDEQGTVINIIVLALDITERKQAEKTLKLITDNMSDMIRMTDLQGVNLYVSPSHAKILGYKPEERVGKSVFDIVHPDDVEHIINVFSQGLINKKPVKLEYRIKHAEGHYLWLETMGDLLRDDQGEVTAVIQSSRDISDRKATEEELRKSEENYRSIYQNAIEGIFQTTIDGRFLSANHALAHILGYESSEDLMALVTNIGMQLYANHEERKEHLRLINKKGEVKGFEVQMRRKDGSKCWVSINTRLVGNDIDQAMHNEGFITDISFRKQAEAEKAKLEAQNQQLQKAESLGRMAGAIAHHFNNQLGVVIGNLDLAIEGLPKVAGLANSMTAAMQAASKAAEMSGLMLTYLGQTPGERVLLDLSETCLRSLPILRAAMPGYVILNTDLPSPGPAISANASQIQQVLTNLLTNAWEAFGENRGAIHLCVKTVSPAEIPTAHRFPIDWQPQKNVYACLDVVDMGSGIKDKDIEKLYDPFFSTKFTGRGLGLSVVMGIVKAHGGVVTVESEPGRGSAFRIFFPMSGEEVLDQPDKAAQLLATEGGGTVLVVEDEEMVRDMARAMLTGLGFTVLEAKDGVEAVDVFQKRQERIRFVLCDLTMPRMNGWETLTALRKLAPDIPVILASGYDKAHVMAGDHSELPQVFLGKPYKLKGLSDAISQALVSR